MLKQLAVHARTCGVEVDIIGCAVMPSGAIGPKERIGIRVKP